MTGGVCTLGVPVSTQDGHQSHVREASGKRLTLCWQCFGPIGNKHSGWANHVIGLHTAGPGACFVHSRCARCTSGRAVFLQGRRGRGAPAALGWRVHGSQLGCDAVKVPALGSSETGRYRNVQAGNALMRCMLEHVASMSGHAGSWIACVEASSLHKLSVVAFHGVRSRRLRYPFCSFPCAC